MNVLFASSELYPLAKTGGLADVLGALPAALQARGHSVSCALPFYREVMESEPELLDPDLALEIPMGDRVLAGRVYQTETPNGVTVFLIRRDEFFDRSGLYGNELGDYQDIAERFIFFSKAVIALAANISPAIDILHAHDWQTGLVPIFAKAAAAQFKTVFTIHNLGYQGSFWGVDFKLCNLPDRYFAPDGGLEHYGHLNCLKAGIVHADQVTTVSPTYAREIQTPAHGRGLDVTLREHAGKLTGILNGIDQSLWCPASDPLIKENYTAETLAEGKAACRRHLLKRADWPKDTTDLIVGVVSRLDSQKGIDLIRDAWPEILRMPVRLVILASGDPDLEAWLTSAMERHPDRLFAEIGFSEKLAHRIQAGCDAVLMPSRYEPCGLSQLYAQRYGTLPIVHGTGGLADTVADWNDEAREGTGFVFRPCTAPALLGALRRAVELAQDRPAWEIAAREGMARDFSWEASAMATEEVYARA